jgi:hypothetical protein
MREISPNSGKPDLQRIGCPKALGFFVESFFPDNT